MYAYFALTKLHWPVSRFAALPMKEKAMTIAMIQEYLEQKRREAAKMKRKR